MKNYLSATQLKNNISEVLNEVYFKGNDVIIERYGKPVAKIIPMKDKNSRLDFSDVTKKTNKKNLISLAGMWNNNDGKIIEENALSLRKKGKFTALKKHELSS